MAKQPLNTFQLKFYAEDTLAFYLLLSEIHRCISNGKVIPRETLKEFNALIQKPVKDAEREKIEGKALLIEKIRGTIAQSGLKKDRYDFSILVTEKNTAKPPKSLLRRFEGQSVGKSKTHVTVQYSFDHFLTWFVERLFLHHDDVMELINDKNQKEQFVRFIYRALHVYLSDMRLTSDKWPTDYKLKLITGLIIMAFGFAPSKSEFDLSNNIGYYTNFLTRQVEHFTKAERLIILEYEKNPPPLRPLIFKSIFTGQI